MNKRKLKLILLYSILVGGILGFLSLIPQTIFFPLMVMSLFSSIIIIYYMQKKREIGELTIKGSAIIGGIIGFIALAGYLLIYLPINAILGLIFSDKTDYFSLSQYLLQIWWILLFMGGLVTALLNAFSLTAYVYIRDTFFMIEGKKEIKGDFFNKG